MFREETVAMELLLSGVKNLFREVGLRAEMVDVVAM